MNNRAEPNLLLLESNYFINGRSRTGIKSLSAYERRIADLGFQEGGGRMGPFF